MKRRISFISGIFILSTILISGCHRHRSSISGTTVSIKDGSWFINDKVINERTPSQGLFMNVRMVNSVFEERGDKMPVEFLGFDAEKNTENFISKISEYKGNGVNGFTISLQGGAPGYDGAVNSAFEADGSLRQEYMERVAKVIRAADNNSIAIILSCFYQRQHSNIYALNGKDAIKEALANTVRWIKKNNFRNVVLEVSNEYRHGGFRNWKDGKWLISTKGQLELISLAKNIYPTLLVSTSGMGDGQMNDSLVKAVDFITIHFNGTSLEDYEARIIPLKEAGKPVICNEDDKTGVAGASALLHSVINGCGWGYMNSRQNQNMPFAFDGVIDDTAVYNMMKKATTPGYYFDESSIRLSSIIITFPKDGDEFKTGQKINARFSYLDPDTSLSTFIKIFTNEIEYGTAEKGRNQYSIEFTESGVKYIQAVVTDLQGNILLKSPKVDIIVK